MSPLVQFIACFLMVSAVTALVSSMVQWDGAWRIAKQAIQFFTWIILGILIFSAIVYYLELRRYAIALGILGAVAAIFLLLRLFSPRPAQK